MRDNSSKELLFSREIGYKRNTYIRKHTHYDTTQNFIPVLGTEAKPKYLSLSVAQLL